MVRRARSGADEVQGGLLVWTEMLGGWLERGL